MKRGKADMVVFSVSRHRSFQLLLFVVTFELPFVFTSIATSGGGGVSHGDSLTRSLLVETEDGRRDAPRRPQKLVAADRKATPFRLSPVLGSPAEPPWEVSEGRLGIRGKLLTELESAKEVERRMSPENRLEACSDSISLSGEEFY